MLPVIPGLARRSNNSFAADGRDFREGNLFGKTNGLTSIAYKNSGLGRSHHNTFGKALGSQTQ